MREICWCYVHDIKRNLSPIWEFGTCQLYGKVLLWMLLHVLGKTDKGIRRQFATWAVNHWVKFLVDQPWYYDSVLMNQRCRMFIQNRRFGAKRSTGCILHSMGFVSSNSISILDIHICWWFFICFCAGGVDMEDWLEVVEDAIWLCSLVLYGESICTKKIWPRLLSHWRLMWVEMIGQSINNSMYCFKVCILQAQWTCG